MKTVRKITAVILTAVMLTACVTIAAYADDFPPMQVEVSAKAAVLMDAATGKVLMAQNANEKLYPASVTKIMSLLLVTEAIDDGRISLSDVVTVSAFANSMGGSEIWLKEGEQMTVDDMLKAVCVASANDACVALGEFVAGSNEAFVKMMNERAAQLGMKNTHFVNCTGLDDTTDEHLTTAYDIALMSRELMKHKRIMNYTTIWMDTLRGGETELTNTNKLVRFYSGCTGLKTGTTSKAGCCLSATATRDNTSLIAVVLGSETSEDRFESAKAMLNWGFANYSTVTPQIDQSLITNVAVLYGVENYLTPVLPETSPVLIEKGNESKMTQSVEIPLNVEAPVEKGQVVGKVILKLGDETVGEYLLTSDREIPRLTFSIAIKRILSAFSVKNS